MAGLVKISSTRGRYREPFVYAAFGAGVGRRDPTHTMTGRETSRTRRPPVSARGTKGANK